MIALRRRRESNEMPQNIERIIHTFQSRVDTLQTDWNVLCDAVCNSKCQSVNGQIALLKSKLDLIQQQHTGIIVDLGIIKTHLLAHDLDMNNQFLTEEQEVDFDVNKENEDPLPLLGIDETEADISEGPKVFKEEFKNEILFSSLSREAENASREMPSRYKVAKSQHSSKIRPLGAKDLNNVENYHLIMTDCPKSVHDLYHEFYTDTKLQILHFGEKHGAGQLSKLPKLRTYQRRSALVNAINKYAKGKNITVEQSIEHFQGIVEENDKTIPWLYNNLAKILEQYGIVQ